MIQYRHVVHVVTTAAVLAFSFGSVASVMAQNPEPAQPYPPDQLYAKGSQRVFKGDASEAAFLLGGIGTGNVSVGARGDLRDWELKHHPDKGNKLPWSYFAIHTRQANGTTATKVLESRIPPPHAGGSGYGAHLQAGLPRFESSSMRGEYPFVWVTLTDPDMPVQVELEAFTPFIPLDADASGIPAAVLRYKVRNISNQRLTATVAGSLANDACVHNAEAAVHDFRTSDGLAGLWYSCRNIEERLKCGSMALVTREENTTTYKREWLRGGWWDGAHDYWDDLAEDGKLEPESKYVSKEKPRRGGSRVGALGIVQELEPNEEKTFEFILAWHFPKRPRGWWEKKCEETSQPCECILDNYYATIFENAWHAAAFLNSNLPRLEKESRTFHDALFASTLPPYVIDALASNITVIRSSTCFRINDGTFFAWEGCHDKVGCCDGTCTHVWNYAQTLAFLFPELERTIRTNEFLIETDSEGKMAFRSRKGFGIPDDSWKHHAAADGQLGTIIRLYRDWKLSGDTEFLRKVWPGASRALNYAFKQWDSNGDYMLDSQQHNTYDIEFYGPNSLVNSMFLGALKAGAAMAQAVGDKDHETTYALALSKSAPLMDKTLWGGEYYIQQLPNVDEFRYQYGIGCLSDQLLGQLNSHIAGLGYILPKEHVSQAIESVFRYNFRQGFSDYASPQRTYALNDEHGLLLCSWPHGGRPRLPFVYSDEVWTGIEYQVAAHLIYEGHLDEGLTMVKAVRDRHDGYRRNPWNEVECGHHYARSLASWGLLNALSGFTFDMLKGEVGFAPVINQDDFRCFWSTGKAWGVYEQAKGADGKPQRKLTVLHGEKDAVRLTQ